MRSFFLRWPLVGLFLLGSLIVFGEGCATTATTCLTDEECGEGFFCNTSVSSCKRECTSSADCPTDQTCFLRRGKCLGGETCASKPARPICVNGHVHTTDGCAFVGDRKTDCGLQGCLDGKCLQAPVGCGDGICDPTQEHCLNCPFDCACPSGELCDTTSSACLTSANCGDGTCDPNEKETCATCPIDCGCAAGQRCDRSQQICIAFPSCGNGSCEPNESEDCSNCPFDCACPLGQRCVNNTCAPTNPCGDGQCSAQQGENCDTCPKDCACPADHSCKAGVCKVDQTNPVRCGDQKCDKSESSASCCTDCGCPSGYKCANNACQLIQTAQCGNGRCEASESSASCCVDCACPSGQSCVNGQCTCTHECAASARRCSGNTPQECQADSKGCRKWANLSACPSGQSCNNGYCQSATCTTHGCPTVGDRICQGNRAMDCITNAQGCRALALGEDCTPKGMTCDQSIPEYARCICVHSCSLGSKRCNGNTPQECKADTHGCRKWADLAACPSGQSCSNGTCAATPPTCTTSHQCPNAGERICQGNRAMDCNTNTQGCRVLVLGEDCTPKGMTCDQSIPDYARCVCVHTCSSGSKRCNSNTIQECKADAHGCRKWADIQTCGTNQTCTNNACQTTCSHKCPTAGERICQGNRAMDCTTDALGCRILVLGEDCTPKGMTCDQSIPDYARCICVHTCSSGSKRCNGSTIQECKADAHGCRKWADIQTCTTGTTCSNGSCVNCNDCSSGKKCSGKDIQECQTVSGCKKWVTTSTCKSNENCSNASCVPTCANQCSSGSRRCSGNSTQVCQSVSGCLQWVTEMNCGTTRTCKNGRCCTGTICIE